MYVEDCAAANIFAMKADTVNEYYDMGTGKRTSILELAKEIQKIIRTSNNIQFLPQGTTFLKIALVVLKKQRSKLLLRQKWV